MTTPPSTRETKTTDTGSNVMKPLIYGTAAAAVLFIGVVIVMWMIKERRKRIKKLELLESLEKEKTGKKRKRKRRHRRSRGPKPVIKVKQSEKLKKALADYLEMHTQTIGSVREEENGSKNSVNRNENREGAGGSDPCSIDSQTQEDHRKTKSNSEKDSM